MIAPLLLITARALAPRPLPEVVAGALAGGCRWLLVREKDLAPAALAALLKELQLLARGCGGAVSLALPPLADLAALEATLKLARSAGVTGLHLPAVLDVALVRRAVGPELLLGASAHSLVEAERAASGGADYLTLSPVFPSPGKPGYGPPLGLAELACIAGRLPIPVVALGGIAPANALGCLRAGAAGVAAMGSLMRAERPAEQVAELISALAPALLPRGP